MNTEEVIKSMRKSINKWYATGNVLNEDVEVAKEAIRLLKCGEKLKAIVEELESCGNRYRFEYVGSNSGKTTEFLTDKIKALKEEYFPKTKSILSDELREGIEEIAGKHFIEKVFDKLFWETMKGFVKDNAEMILKCMEKAEKNGREK